jgi:hypothetical protein
MIRVQSRITHVVFLFATAVRWPSRLYEASQLLLDVEVGPSSLPIIRKKNRYAFIDRRMQIVLVRE